MAVTNNNKKMIDRPMWEQLAYAPAASAIGTCQANDGSRFIYTLFSATSFWRYDTWADSWQQLANPPSGTCGAGTTIRYTGCMGGQSAAGEVNGGIFAVIANATAPAFAWYNITTNVWGALSAVNLPATFGTEGSLTYPDPATNGWATAAIFTTVTANAAAAISATSITTLALPAALPIGAVLNFGTAAVPKYAVLTAAAAAAAVTITVAPLTVAIASGNASYWYDHMYLVGNAGTQMYRYQLSTNVWSTTNPAAAALPAIPAAVGAGCALKWANGTDANTITLMRGAATAGFYDYSFSANTWSAARAVKPETETFTAGTCASMRTDANGKTTTMIIHKEATNRIYELDLVKNTIKPIAYQYLIPQGAVLVGDKGTIIKSPDGIEFYYMLLHTSQYFVRTALFF